MKQYKATVLTILVGGNVKLDEDQVRRRRHILTANKDGTHAVEGKIQFKAGEEFGYDGAIPKGMAVAELTDEAEAELAAEEVTEYPNHLGGGTYELSTGEKVRGKKAAIYAEAELAD